MYESDKLLSRASLLGITMPMHHATGVMVRARSTLALFGITLAVCATFLAVIMLQALEGHDLDIIFWWLAALCAHKMC